MLIETLDSQTYKQNPWTKVVSVLKQRPQQRMQIFDPNELNIRTFQGFGELTALPEQNPWTKVASALEQRPQQQRQVFDPNALNIRWLLRQLLLGQGGGQQGG